MLFSTLFCFVVDHHLAMSGLGYFAEDIVDRANFPETAVGVPSYADESQEIIGSTDETYVPEAVKKFIIDFHKAFRNKVRFSVW